MSRIDIHGLHFYYEESHPVLQGIDLVLEGVPTAIIGQNGAGKTTFVKLLKGLLRPTGGSLTLDGEPLAEKTAAQIAPHIGLVFQNPNDQIFKNKVLDEVLFGPLQIGMDREQALESARRALSLLGLTGMEQENPYDLGLSDRKMVAIASILAMDTGTVIFDEPTIAQDSYGKGVLREVIAALRREGKLVLAILHDMDFAAACFERIIVFSQGRVLLDGSPAEVFRRTEQLAQARLEPPHVAQLCLALGLDRLFFTVEALAEHLRSLRRG